MNPLLSIIVPVYKVEAYLNRCVDSILAQTFTDIEVILVDDGSPDNCGMMCDEYALKDSRIKVIHKPNGGLSSARNAGIAMAQGKYITFVDSDDEVSMDVYTKNMAILQVDPTIDLLEYPVYVHYQSPGEHIWKPNSDKVSGNENIFIYWIENEGYQHSYTVNKIYKRELFDSLSFPEGSYFEDVYFMSALLPNVQHIYWSEYGLYYYYYNNASITTLPTYIKQRDLVNANLKLWREAGNYSIRKEKLLVYYLYLLNLLIDLLGYKELEKEYSNRLIEEFAQFTFSLRELLQAPVPKRMKYKNILTPLIGLRAHCSIFTTVNKLRQGK